MTQQDLTAKQSVVLHFWNDYQLQHEGEPPSIRGASISLGFKSTNSIQQIIEVLIKKGFMKPEPKPGEPGKHSYIAVDGRQSK